MHKDSNKIVHVISVFPSKSETFIINLIVESLKAGFTSQILTDHLRDISISSQQELLTENSLYQKAETYNPIIPENKLKRLFLAIFILIKNIKYSAVFFRTLNYKKYGLKSKTLKMWFQASVFLKHRDAAIFHGHFGINGKLLAEMKAIGAIKGKLITSFYGYDTFSTDQNRETLKKDYLNLFAYSDYIITSSQYLYNNLMKLGTPKNKIIINPVGVNQEVFKFKKRTYTGSLNIITVGRLIKLKGQHYGIDVIKILKDKGYNITYTIVGEGKEYGVLEKKIKDNQLQDVVTLLGSKTQKDILELLYNNNLFLMTSITNEEGRAEGQGLVIAEAQASGLPIVAFNSGGVSETIDHKKTGFVVEEKNINAMAEAIEKFMEKPELFDEFGNEARKFVEQHFSNTIQSNTIIKLYQSNG